MDYAMSYGSAKAYEQLIKELEGADDRVRMIAVKIEQENVKQQLATPKKRR